MPTRIIHAGRCGLLLSLILLLGACAGTRVVDSWKSDAPVSGKPEKVAVIAVLPDALTRLAVEKDVAKVLADKGTPAIPASEIEGMSGGIRGEIDTQVAARLLRDAGVDGVVVMFYSGGGTSEGYERSDYWAEYLGSGVPYNWGYPYFTPYTDVYTIRKGPGYSDFQRNAYVESSYYDLVRKVPVWRIVTFTKDLQYSDAASEVAHKIASEMRSAGLN